MCLYFFNLIFSSISGHSLDMESLKYMYAMVFTVEEINRDTALLPGVRLGYRIRDSCFRYPWELDAALSLVAGDLNSCNMTASSTDTIGGKTAAGKSCLKLKKTNKTDL